MNLLAVFQLVTLGINLFLLGIVVTRFLRTPVGQAYTYVILCIVLWSVGDVMTTLSQSPNQAMFWEWIGEISALFLGPFLLRFIKIRIENNFPLHNNVVRMIFIMSSILVIAGLKRHVFVDDAVLTSIGYRIKFASGYTLLSSYAALVTVGVIVIAVRSLAALRGLKKKQMQILIFAFGFPLIGGIISEIILPTLGLFSIPLTIPIMSVTGIIIVYAIGKYQFLSITPSVALATIFDTVNDALIVVDTNGKIELANRTTNEMLGYASEQLIGKYLPLILKNSNGSQLADNQLFITAWTNTQMAFVPNNNSPIIPVHVTASPIVVSDETLGVVLAIRDMTKINELINTQKQKTTELEVSKQLLETKMKEVQDLNDLMTGREMKMVDLKKQIADLEKQIKTPLRVGKD